MNRRQMSRAPLLAIGLTLALLDYIPSVAAAPQPAGAEITYQGYLENTGIPTSGVYDLDFRLYDGPDPQSSAELASVQRCGVEISRGLFSVELDFGAAVFDGEQRWLEVGLAPAGPCDVSTEFTYLEPLQQLTATPYALFALSGNEGPPGADGSKWFTGTGAPAVILGSSGDLYLDTTSGDVYRNSAGTWSVIANLTGPAGAPGASPFGINGSAVFYNVGNFGLGTTNPAAKLHVTEGNVLFSGTAGVGSIPVQGAGTRFMWYPAKSALRAGQVTLNQWDDANTGANSIGLGFNTTASGANSVALGHASKATSDEATALGRSTTASGQFSTAMGFGSQATGPTSTAMGSATTASGSAATAWGLISRATQNNATAWGWNATASGEQATAMGQNTLASGNNSLASGVSTEARAFASVATGRYNETGGSPNNWNTNDHLFVIGNGTSDVDRRNAVTVLKNGNVGVGLSNPNQRLDVAGNIEATGTICGANGCVGQLAAGSQFAIVQGTRDSEATSGQQVLAHTLGSVPARVEITALAGLRETAMSSFGFSDGVNNSCSFLGGQLHAAESSNAHAIYIRYDKDGSNIRIFQRATVILDASNVTIHWESGDSSSFVDDFKIAFTIRVWS